MSNLPELDLEEIVGSSPTLDTPLSPFTVMWSPYSRQRRNASTLRELLHEVISDVTQQPMLLSDTIKILTEHLASCKRVIVNAPGGTPHLPVLQKAISSKGIECVTAGETQDKSTPQQTERGGSNRIAIVGMSGRFPGSENVADYFQSLLDAERYIREVCFHPNGSF
jgi:hypothetical protein